MKTIKATKQAITESINALHAALAAEEPDEIAAALATSGNGIATAIRTMDGQFKGFRRDVETAARKLEARA